MNCSNCGLPLPESAKFCPQCGTRVQQARGAFCSVCGTKLGATDVYCPGCGVKVNSDPLQKTAGAGTTVSQTAAEHTTAGQTAAGRLLFSLKMVSMYEGTPTVGIAKATGPLTVYDDRIEFKKQLGNALGGIFGPIGMTAAKNSVKKDPVSIYPVSQIAHLRVGKYGGVYNTLVVILRDGTTVSFCPSLPGSSEPQNIINSLQPYLR